MDIVVEKKNFFGKRKKLIGLVVVGLVAAAALVRYVLIVGQAEFSVDRENIVIGEVQHGDYTVSVRGTGILVPDNIKWLAANVEATVVRRVLKAGHRVKKGDLIVELASPQLIQELSEIKWELQALEADLIAERVDQEMTLQQQRVQVLSDKREYEAAVTEYNAREELMKIHAVSKLDFNRSKVAMGQARQRWLSAKETLAKMEENLVAQNNAREARLNQTKKKVERTQQKVDDLQVRASMNGTILEVPVEAGQRVAMGDSLAKLAEENSLIAELQVPEIQIRDVAVGQKVLIDTRNSTIDGVVSRIDPAVANGNVLVDVKFTGELPDDVRPDLSVDGVITITKIPNAIHVERPLFVQSRSHSTLYKLSEDGRFAERVEVELGYGSINRIQVLAGLDVGDKIVVSDMTRFQSYTKFRLN